MNKRDQISSFRAVTSTHLAQALICGIDECSEEDVPLSQVQRVHLAKMSMMAYHDAVRDFITIVDMDKILSSIKKEVQPDR